MILPSSPAPTPRRTPGWTQVRDHGRASRLRRRRAGVAGGHALESALPGRRQRLATPAQIAALTVQGRPAVPVPGLREHPLPERPSRPHWLHGRRTDVDNLLMIFTFHHTLIHDQATHPPDAGRWDFLRGDGQPSGSVDAADRSSGEPHRDQLRAGLRITRDSSTRLAADASISTRLDRLLPRPAGWRHQHAEWSDPTSLPPPRRRGPPVRSAAVTRSGTSSTPSETLCGLPTSFRPCIQTARRSAWSTSRRPHLRSASTSSSSLWPVRPTPRRSAPCAGWVSRWTNSAWPMGPAGHAPAVAGSAGPAGHAAAHPPAPADVAGAAAALRCRLPVVSTLIGWRTSRPTGWTGSSGPRGSWPASGS